MDIRRRISFNMNTDSNTSGSIDTSNYMTILALEDGLTASLSTNASQYCVDGDGNWIDLPPGTTTQSINRGQTLSFKGNLTPSASSGIGTFTISRQCNLEGNCMSLLFGDNAMNNYSLFGKDFAFYELFYGCTTIRQVSKAFLPATTLAVRCYQNMFRDCIRLTAAPSILPAITLADYCYSNMFYNCDMLTSTPVLPATTLAVRCYYGMFYSCNSLITAPVLPATILTSYCYYGMFYNCGNLEYIKMLAIDISASNCLTNWVRNVSSKGIFEKNKNATWNVTGANGIPSGWSIKEV